VSFRVPEQTRRLLDERARVEGRKPSEIAREALDQYLSNYFGTLTGTCGYATMRRWTVSPTARVEILDRLLEENHRRGGGPVTASVTKSPAGPRGAAEAPARLRASV